MKSIEGNFTNPLVDELLKKHFIELRSVSPTDSCHVLDIDGLKNSSIKFWSLWENDQLIGCGALKFLEDKHGELKSIRVAKSFKNKGLLDTKDWKMLYLKAKGGFFKHKRQLLQYIEQNSLFKEGTKK